MLLPNNKQKTRMFHYVNASRFAYNWTIEQEKKSYESDKKFISDGDLRKQFTQYKKSISWLQNIYVDVTKQAIKDACTAYENFFKGKSKFPRFKSRKRSRSSFYIDAYKIKVTNTHIWIPSLVTSKKVSRLKGNWVRLAEHNRIPIGIKYYNPRVVYDGLNWWISVSVEETQSCKIPKNPGIGIDLGIKNLAICSDGYVYENINKHNKITRLKKRKKRLQRSISRKYEINKKGVSYCKTNNIKKLEIRLLKLNRRLMNIRHNHIHQMTSEIVKREPNFIVIEDLNVKGMLKNKHLSKAIQEQCFYEVHKQLEYKCNWNNINLVIADRFYPSSKKCCKCGNIKTNLKLNDRVYRCDKCGNVIDRDYQASINLRNYVLI